MPSYNSSNKWLISRVDSLNSLDPDKTQSPEDRKAYQDKWAYFRNKGDWEKWILFSPHKRIKYAILDLWGNAKKYWNHPTDAFETEESITIIFETPEDKLTLEIEFFFDRVTWKVSGGDSPSSMEELFHQTDLLARAVKHYPIEGDAQEAIDV